MGREWNGRKVRQAGVLYVSVEAGRGIRYRLEAFQRHHGLDLVDVPFFVVTEPTSLLEPTGVAQVLADASRVPNLGLIVIDTAARVAGGDEGAENFSLLVSACDHIRAATDVNLTMVHHAGKDSSRGSRGSTVLPAAADTIIEVTRDKTTKISTAKIEKQRDGEAGPLLNFNLKVIETGTDADGDTISSCVVEPTDQKPAKSTTPKQRRALKVLHNVLVDHGSRAPNTKHYPSGAIVTDVGLWREYLEKAGVLDAHASNPRTPFKRLRDGMIDRGLIGEWDGLVWAVRDK